MSPEVYVFDGRWWYSRDGQLRPLPESVTNRDEAKVEARKILEPEREDVSA